MEFLLFLLFLVLLITAFNTFLGIVWYFFDDGEKLMCGEYNCKPKYTKTANALMSGSLFYLNFFGNIGWFIGKGIGKVLNMLFLAKDGESGCN